MWNLLLIAGRAYLPFLLLPITILIGTIGYTMEAYLRNPVKERGKSVKDARDERYLKEIQNKTFGQPKFKPLMTEQDEDI